MENYSIYQGGELTSCTLDELKSGLGSCEVGCIDYLVGKVDDVQANLRKRKPLLDAERELDVRLMESFNPNYTAIVDRLKIAKQGTLEDYERAILDALKQERERRSKKQPLQSQS